MDKKSCNDESDDDDIIELVDELSKSHQDSSSSMSANSSLNKSGKSTRSEEDAGEVPSGPDCLARCKEFAQVTGTDRALAMFYLQEKKWNLQKSLDFYFESTGNGNEASGTAAGVSSASKPKKVVACFDTEKLDEDEDWMKIRMRNYKKMKTDNDKDDDKNSSGPLCSNQSDSANAKSSNQSDQKEDEKHFKVMSWNIDGLDQKSLESRTIGVVETILKENPDIVMLQEVIETSEEIIKQKLSSMYELITGKLSCEYYTAMLIRRKSCKIISKNVIRFENSVMGRCLLEVKLTYKGLVKVCALTSHLESTKDFAKIRIEQLRKCLSHMTSQDSDMIVIFGGDLNMRDTELTVIGGMPTDVCDIWESTGKRKECLYTWDCLRNTNLTINSKFKPRCRFDRMFYRPSKVDKSDEKKLKASTLMPVYFELEGLNRLKSCSRFCSDHWAIQSYFQLE